MFGVTLKNALHWNFWRYMEMFGITLKYLVLHWNVWL